jgi:hypothetical protein
LVVAAAVIMTAVACHVVSVATATTVGSALC